MVRTAVREHVLLYERQADGVCTDVEASTALNKAFAAFMRGHPSFSVAVTALLRFPVVSSGFDRLRSENYLTLLRPALLGNPYCIESSIRYPTICTLLCSVRSHLHRHRNRTPWEREQPGLRHNVVELHCGNAIR